MWRQQTWWVVAGAAEALQCPDSTPYDANEDGVTETVTEIIETTGRDTHTRTHTVGKPRGTTASSYLSDTPAVRIMHPVQHALRQPCRVLEREL